MTAKSLLVDTNVLIHHWDGDARTTPLLEDTIIHVSFVTEIEILGFHGYTAHERAKVTADLAFIKIVDLDDGIKSAAIDFRARYRMKLADALIAATAIRLGVPLVTEDKHFKKLKNELTLHLL
ncbi:MAG: type II toxin-antitoxin system VapC family toxin [Flavobacteriales bacterium]|jgi:predicted nucleic acid-binding protein|nr:type II toxin-antitoxin system VapC family toxin [Flavobacteriales bacterium]MBK9699798.1 type II toxin-antitoxin system VapC family toxin [Flavobacteriales bacterium]